MLVPYACVTSLIFLSTMFSAISLFTYGWATIYPFDPLYPIIPVEEIIVGLVPFDSEAFGWLIATSIFMYLNFACILFCLVSCILGLLVFMLRGDSRYQKYIFVGLGAFCFLAGLFGAVAFLIFVLNYSNEFEDYFQGDVSIGYSPFLDLVGFVIATAATGVSAFFAISLLNPNETN